MTRSNAREIAMHLIYAMDCTGEEPEEILNIRMAQEYYERLAEENDVYTDRPNRKQFDYIQSILKGVQQQKDALNAYISKYAIGWNLGRISRLAKAILQLAIYESLYVEDVPTSVAINEAVELARKYDNEDIVSFVNGILGTFAREESLGDAKEVGADDEEQAEGEDPETASSAQAELEAPDDEDNAHGFGD